MPSKRKKIFWNWKLGQNLVKFTKVKKKFDSFNLGRKRKGKQELKITFSYYVEGNSRNVHFGKI